MSHEINIGLLADSILKFREENGLTVRKAAEQMEGVSTSTLSRIERGSLPDIDTYMRICKWLGVAPGFFAISKPIENSREIGKSLTKEDIIVHLRADKLLNQQTRDALITMLEVSYAAARRNLLPNESQSTTSGIQG